MAFKMQRDLNEAEEANAKKEAILREMRQELNRIESERKITQKIEAIV